MVPPAKLYFDVAYARYDVNYHDTLFVSLTNDCGVTYNTLYTKGDNVLATAPNTTAEFVPTATQWRRDSVDISAYVGSPAITVRFEAKSGFGNNLYIDNINLTGNGFVGITQPDFANEEIRVYPNPFTNQLTIGRGQWAGKNKETEIKVYDIFGRTIFRNGFLLQIVN